MAGRNEERDCPNCGVGMAPARVTPKIGPYPDLLTFRCDRCGEVETVEKDDTAHPS